MPTNQHYEAVRAKVIAACPELMELSPNCVIADNCGYGYKVWRVFPPLNGVQSVKTDNGEYNDISEFKIIGHPIRLSHILRTLALKDNGFELNNQREDRMHLVSLVEFATGETCNWNLKKDDLASQPPETWEALDKMLSV